jgi:hypothetical protein
VWMVTGYTQGDYYYGGDVCGLNFVDSGFCHCGIGFVLMVLFCMVSHTE